MIELLPLLKIGRLRALTNIQVHSRLEEYQKAANQVTEGSRSERKEARKLLENEKHHPTDKLASYMRAVGRVQPSPRVTAHHIVQGKGKTEAAAFARVLDRSYMGHIERGEKNITILKIFQIAEALEISPKELLP